MKKRKSKLEILLEMYRIQKDKKRDKRLEKYYSKKH